MRAIVQRVSSAMVEVDGQTIGSCGHGLLLLVGVHRADDEIKPRKLADKVLNLRIFNDSDGKMNLSLSEVADSSILVVSNFTVYGDTRNRRPSFIESAPYDRARILFDRFVEHLKEFGLRVETGEFGADMQVRLVNDGPVTLIVDV